MPKFTSNIIWKNQNQISKNASLEEWRLKNKRKAKVKMILKNWDKYLSQAKKWSV